MPKIRIREKDRSLNEQEAISNYIFMLDDNANDSEIKVCTKIEDASTLSNKDLIEKIIKLGGGVIVAKSYPAANEYLKDRNQYDVKFLLADQKQLDNETSDTSDTSEIKFALEIAEARRDCCVIYSKTASGMDDNEKTLFKKALSSDDDFIKNENDACGKYVLAFYGKELKNSKSDLKPGVAYILAYLNSAKNNPEWLAVAGAKRGEIPLETVDCSYLTENDIDTMQPANCASISVNPIVKMSPWGVRIWGNRTCFSSEDESKNTGLVASSFANLRVLICDIKKELYKAARKYQFEQNTDILWVNFQSSVNVLLEEMVHSYGIAGYRWYREETKDRAKLCATLQIVPIEPVEDFDLTLELVDSLEISE